MEKLKNKKAVIYTRVSTNDQKLYNNSISNQKCRVEDFCLQNDISIIKVFEEVYSGKDFNRPVFNEMIEFIHQNKTEVDYLLVSSWDRFGRNLQEASRAIEMFRNYGVEVNSIDQWMDHEDTAIKEPVTLFSGLPIGE